MMSSSTLTSTRRYEIITGLVILGLGFGSFLLAELGLRAVQFVKFGVQKSVESSSAFYTDKETGLRLIHPNRRLGAIRINNLGYRGPDITVKRPDGVIRVVFMGSSTTYDASSPEGRNWPHRTITALSQALPNCRFEFINAGQPGFGTETITTLYDARLRKLEPDIAIILPGDINQDLDWLTKQQGMDTRHYVRSTLAQFSVLWAKMEKNFRIIELQRGAFSRTGKVRLELPLLANRFRGRLTKLTSILRKDGVATLVAKIGSQLRPGQPRKKQLQAANSALFYMPKVALPDIIATRLRFNEVIETLAPQTGYEVLESALGVPADPVHYTDTIHFTPAGSDLMARATTTEMLASPIVRKRLAKRGCHVR